MSTVGRADLRNAFAYASPDLEKGTNSRLKKNTGINFLFQLQTLKKKKVS